MRIYILLFLISVCVVPILSGQSTYQGGASIGNATATPLNITFEETTTDILRTPNASTLLPAIVMNVANVSGKCLRGYVVVVKFKEADGHTTQGHSRLALAMDKESNLSCFPPGAVKHWGNPLVRPKDSSGELAQYSATIDLVIFEDGSEWGPGKAPDSDRLRGMIEALIGAGKIAHAS